jgi:hypothetical protein
MSNRKDKPSLPLPMFWKIMTFLFPITVLSGAIFIIPSHIYERSREDAWTWSILGAIAWTMVILVFIGLKAIHTIN